ncbi:MAG: LysO family transporter [Candidatus Bathyarchaeales archaeon]
MPDILDIAKLVLPLVAGIAAGYFLKERKRLNLNKIISAIILVLIFSLGFTMGSNNELLAVLPNVGLTTIVLLTTALFFSILFVKAARKLVKT